tara:strand:- start:102 stop:491 length:390 start_codon:yes stop_codon:yes gene_type:complete
MSNDAARLGGVGILTDQDLADLKGGVRRVFDLMSDGEWYDRNAICLAAGTDGIPASEGMRRMRELRQWFEVERRNLGGRRWVYRLVIPKEMEQMPFLDDAEEVIEEFAAHLSGKVRYLPPFSLEGDSHA